MAIRIENLRDWQGKNVVDPEGSKVGTLEAVYVDTLTDEPSFITVTAGGLLSGRKLAFVPLENATVSPDHVRVAFGRDIVRNAPSIDTDGELRADEEPAVFAHYSLPHAGTGGRRLARR